MSANTLQSLLAAAEHRLGAGPVYPMPGIPGWGGSLFGQFPTCHPLGTLCQLTSVASLAPRQDASCQTDPDAVSQGAAVIPVAARLERVQQAVSCQTVSPSTVQVGAGGGTSSKVVGEHSDPRGRHWQDKVNKGMYSTPSEWNKHWATKRHEKEAEFLAHFAAKGQKVELPWKEGGVSPANTGNKCKVLYFWLLDLHERGVLDLGKTHPTQGFFGITKILVPKATRSVFDAGDFPSVSSIGKHDKRYKEMARTWQIAGFRETVDKESGDLKYEYDAKLQKRVRAQFNDTHLRHMARVAKEREEKAGV
jgi:hypothetical protein